MLGVVTRLPVKGGTNAKVEISGTFDGPAMGVSVVRAHFRGHGSNRDSNRWSSFRAGFPLRCRLILSNNSSFLPLSGSARATARSSSSSFRFDLLSGPENLRATSAHHLRCASSSASFQATSLTRFTSFSRSSSWRFSSNTDPSSDVNTLAAAVVLFT